MTVNSSRRIPKLHLTQIHRFWLNVDQLNGPDSCWRWTGYIGRNGYGIIGIKGFVYKAHRASYFLEHGRIDSKLYVLHKCDVRRCVNPKHLYQGTPKDNARDAVKKGRNTRLYGESNGKHKLTLKQVRSIKKTLKDNLMYQYRIAQYHGVSEATVSYLKNGGRWDNVPLD